MRKYTEKWWSELPGELSPSYSFKGNTVTFEESSDSEDGPTATEHLRIRRCLCEHYSIDTCYCRHFLNETGLNPWYFANLWLTFPLPWHVVDLVGFLYIDGKEGENMLE